jgi:hypothetical protein
MAQSFSILSMHQSQKTMTQFQCGVLFEQSHDSLTGREGKANLGHPFATGHLQGTVSRGSEG